VAEVVLSVAFRYEECPELRRVLEDFRDMVNFCVRRALETGITSFARLRREVYAEFKRRWSGYATHYCHSAVKVATSMLKSWRNKCRKGLADPNKPPQARKLFMRLDPGLFTFYGDRVRITVAPRRWLWLKLVVGKYQSKFVEVWRRGELKVGEIAVNECYVYVPFRKTVDLSNPRDWIALDINEESVVAVSSNPHAFRWSLKEVKRIHYVYHEKRRRIQRIKGKRRAKLLKKYNTRHRNRIRDLLHKLSRTIVNTAKQLDAGILMEDLKGIKQRIKYGKSMNRRLHQFWNPRRLQFYIDYKARLAGLPVHYLNPRGTSQRCPLCGGKLALNGYRWVRCRCGYASDRDTTACLNLLKMWGCAPTPNARQ